MKKHMRIFACYFRLNLASAMEYRASFAGQVFGMALSNSSFVFFWWVAFGQLGGAIAGYHFKDVLFIWAITSAGYGLSDILFDNASNLTNLIVTGELDAFLRQPCNILLNILCARTRLSAYGDFFYGFIVMGLFYISDPAAWLWFLYGTLLGGLAFTAIKLMGHSLSFYWGDASPIAGMATEFSINFSLYPDKIYAPAIRALMFSVIPAGLVVHIPLRLYRAFTPWQALASLAGVALYCALTAILFYRGLRRYESGNMLVTRM